MTKAESRACAVAYLDEWLLASGWERNHFMGWAFTKGAKITHCNRVGAVEMQLRRDGQERRKVMP
jgi:hypothetical protein